MRFLVEDRSIDPQSELRFGTNYVDIDASRPQKRRFIADLRADTRPVAQVPPTISKLAVVTGVSKARGDIEKTLAKCQQNPTLTYFDCSLRNRDSIAKAIEKAVASHPDAIIVARGGGDLEELATFNCVVVVNAVFTARAIVPVVTGIGHADDTVLADEFATISSSTPTQAVHDLYNEVERARSELERQREDAERRRRARIRNRLLVAAAVVVVLAAALALATTPHDF